VEAADSPKTAAWGVAMAADTPSRAVAAGFEQPAGKTANPSPRRLEIPGDLPGSDAPPIRLPPLRPGMTDPQRRAAIEQLYRELPQIGGLPAPEPAEGGKPLSLAELQDSAVQQSPLVHQAAADVDAARGAAIQAGAYYNPHLGYQADNMNTARSAGYQGAAITQTLDTGGKLGLARAAACVDVENAQMALRRAHFDLTAKVRSGYFAVLVAQEKVRINRALVAFADGVYRAQVARVTAGEAAAYEPLQLRVLSLQARTQLVQAQNEYQAAWRRLAATLNMPDMPPTQLAGSVDADVPAVTYERARGLLLEHHTDLAIARNSVTKARYQLQLARVTGAVPNLDVGTVVQRDMTTAPFGTTVNVQIGAPLPIFDRKRGDILTAEAGLVRARHEWDRARNDLTANLADAFARYQTASVTLGYYRSEILINQIRAYRAIYERYQQQPDAVSFNDIVTAQQTVAVALASYIQAIGDQWQALVDLAAAAQIDDLFQWDARPASAPPGPDRD
jgi:outer membrane protein, heavy metal efflux system